MKSIGRIGILSAILATQAGSCLAQAGAAPAQAPVQAAVPVAASAQAQPQSACGNQPLCADSPDFTATVTDFRMTNSNGYKLMDLTIRFQNKTNDTLILGYADGSEMAMDDQGNRYGPAPWGNAYRGIGLVAGNNMDAKFVMRPGSWGDARFELAWRPGAQDPIGNAFEYMISIREINTLTGGQHSLGGEFPLRFSGLANGVAGVSPAYAGGPAGGAGYVGGAAAGAPVAGGQALPPCGAPGSMAAASGAANGSGNAAATNAAAQANSAATTLSSLGALFKRKPAANTSTNASTGQPCAPAGNAAAAPANPSAAPAQQNAVVRTSATASGTATTTPAVARTSTQGGAPVTTVVKAPTAPNAAKPGTPAANASAAKPATAPAPAKPATATAAKPAPAAKTTPAPVKKPAPDPNKPATTQ